MQTAILLHMINTHKSSGGFAKQLKQAQVVESCITPRTPVEKAAYAEFVIAMAYFESEDRPYRDIKSKLKNALVRLHGESQTIQRMTLVRMILHNLAVINYSEIQDYNERLAEQEAEGVVDNTD